KSETSVRVNLESKIKETPAAAPSPAPSRGMSRRTIVGLSLVSVGGVALVVSGVMALQALSLSHDYENPQSKSFQSPDVKSEGIGFRTGADIALLVGLLAGTG